MGDDNEFTKLPPLQRCTHKLWKARLDGYTEVAKLFQGEQDEKAAIFGQYAGLLGKFVGDSNAAAQEKGLEATLYFVQNSNLAGKTVKDVMGVIVNKCVAAPKKGTQDLAVQVTLMYIEAEKQEVVVDEVVKGLEAKNPKIVAACLSVLTTALRDFGSQVVGVKPMIKPLINLLEDRDKTVRDESKALTVEIYRWIGDAIKPQLSKLKPIQLTELEVEFGKVKGERAVPTRYLKSQQAKQAKAAAAEEADGVDGDVEAPVVEEIDPLSLIDPINIISKIPNDFYEKLEAKKWQERKEALEALEKILDYPKFEKGDYGDLVRALLKVVTKDSNVVVVGIATKCIGRLVLGLKKGFQPYAHSALSQLLAKFKEKKANVVTPLREAVDAIFPITSLEAIQEDVIASLDNKNPSIKAETAAFLGRSFAQCTPAVLNKKILKAYSVALLKSLNEPDPTVRDYSAEALGVAMKVVGENVMTPFLPDVDAMKMSKIKESFEKAVVKAAPAQRAAPGKKAAPAPAKADPAPKKVLSGGAMTKQAPKVQKPSSVERELSPEEIDEKASALLPENVLTDLGDAAWKTRLDAIEVFQNVLMSMEPSEDAGEVMIKILNKKPGLKDNNFQVTKLKLDCLKYIAENLKVGTGVVTSVVPDVTEKLSDLKNWTLAGETLMALAEATNLETVGSLVLQFAFGQKSVKIQQEALDWTAEAIQNFGFILSTGTVISYLKKGLSSTNAAVRQSAAGLAGIVSMYMGADQLLQLLDEKPAAVALVTAEIEKHAGEDPLEPSRTCKINAPLADAPLPQAAQQQSREGSPEEKPKSEKPAARVDISLKITEQLLGELGGKNWKDRNEALLSIQGIVTEAKAIKSNLGELPPILCQRFVDANLKISTTALELCASLATAMGPGSKNQLRNFSRGIFTALGDNKQVVRTAAMACLNTWVAEAGVKEFFQGEVIPDALKAGSTSLRIELWTWLGEVLPTTKGLPKDELAMMIPHLFAALEDRAADVRKAGNGAVFGMMSHLGYSAMAREVEKLKPASKAGILLVLDKVRPDVVEMAPPSAKKPEAKPKTAPQKAAAPKARASMAVAAKPSSRKKDEEFDSSPLLMVNKMKNQRLLDEQKLKILKWNFSTPRPEFVELLRDQMTAAGFNKNLIANMFHADFKLHLKAIESLNDDLGNEEALIANLDLIMKWLTLRFFDTNPSVLLKGLEYLQSVFTILIGREYTMFDVEANSFIPYLVLKIGDPKDAVRDRVHAMVKQFSLMYTPGKLFLLIMDGLKSKNSRQRTECLDELGYLIEQFGTSVCLPTPAAALKEISKQIADRDNSVRSAALNAIVKAYFVDGEKIYKMIGQLSDKDMSYLEERIKRASQNRSKVQIMKPEPKQEQVRYEEPQSRYAEPEIPEDEEPEEPEPTPTPVAPTRPRLWAPESHYAPTPKLPTPPELIEIDYSFLNEPIYIPERLQMKMNMNLQPPSNPPVEAMIKDVASLNLDVALTACLKLDKLLNGEAGDALAPYAKSILDSLAMQLSAVNTYSSAKHGSPLGTLYKVLLRIIDHIFKEKAAISKAADENQLKVFIQGLLFALVYDKTAEFREGGYNQNIAAIIHTITEKSDKTNVAVAAINAQFDLVANPPANSRLNDLTAKCLLKILVSIRRAESIDSIIDLDRVLYACHLFMVAYPRHTWKDRPSELPAKAVKTLLLHLVQIKGVDILNHIRGIENHMSSELAAYLRKLIIAQGHSGDKSQTKLTKAMSDHLSQVFMKIAYEATAKEGMLQFYEFKKQHPDVDLSGILAPTTQFFQDYVAKGLTEIEQERGPLAKPLKVATPKLNPSNEVASTARADDKMAPLYYLNVLRDAQKKLGVPMTSLDLLKTRSDTAKD